MNVPWGCLSLSEFILISTADALTFSLYLFFKFCGTLHSHTGESLDQVLPSSGGFKTGFLNRTRRSLRSVFKSYTRGSSLECWVVLGSTLARHIFWISRRPSDKYWRSSFKGAYCNRRTFKTFLTCRDASALSANGSFQSHCHLIIRRSTQAVHDSWSSIAKPLMDALGAPFSFPGNVIHFLAFNLPELSIDMELWRGNF